MFARVNSIRQEQRALHLLRANHYSCCDLQEFSHEIEWLLFGPKSLTSSNESIYFLCALNPTSNSFYLFLSSLLGKAGILFLRPFAYRFSESTGREISECISVILFIHKKFPESVLETFSISSAYFF